MGATNTTDSQKSRTPGGETTSVCQESPEQKSSTTALAKTPRGEREVERVVSSASSGIQPVSSEECVGGHGNVCIGSAGYLQPRNRDGASVVGQEETFAGGAAVEIQAISCPAGHALTTLQTPCKGYGCDLCRKVVPKGARLHGCRRCNWDACDDCKPKAAAATSDAEPSEVGRAGEQPTTPRERAPVMHRRRWRRLSMGCTDADGAMSAANVRKVSHAGEASPAPSCEAGK